MQIRYRLQLTAWDGTSARRAAACLQGELLRVAREAKCLLFSHPLAAGRLRQDDSVRREFRTYGSLLRAQAVAVSRETSTSTPHS